MTAKLSDLVTAWLTTRAPGWVVQDETEATACGLNALEFYAGYGPIRSLNGTTTVTDLTTVTADVVLTPGEWAVVRPLFILYLEFENAQRLESSRNQGLEVFGRSTDAVKADITKAEEDIQKRSFVQEVEILGFQGGSQLPCPGSFEYEYPYGFPYGYP